MTHLGTEMADQVQQLLHAPPEGRGVVTGPVAQRQRVRVQPGEVADEPGVRGHQLAGLGPFVRLGPARNKHSDQPEWCRPPRFGKAHRSVSQ